MIKVIVRWAALGLAGVAGFYLFGAFTLWEPDPAAWAEVMRGFVAGASVFWTIVVSPMVAVSAMDDE